jgi:glycosyltransferase involved in cell wall biosynthesis
MLRTTRLVNHAPIESPADAPVRPSTGAGGRQRHVALFIDDLGGGGVQRMAIALAGGFIDRGCRVDLVVCRATGPLRSSVPDEVKLVELEAARYGLARLYALAADPAGFKELLHPILLRWKTPRDLAYLPDLVRYLKREAPDVLLAATPFLNLEAVWAGRLAGAAGTRIAVSERHNLSFRIQHKPRQRALPPLIRRAYTMADSIVAVSDAVGDDLASVTGIPRESITTIYNPVVTPDLRGRALEPMDHPWFAPGEPPVVISVGRLVMVKDYPTLLRAFARVRALRDVRLLILGEDKDAQGTARRRAELMALAAELGVAAAVELPGFAPNPLAYMARAAVFVLSSAWEGFGNVLVEALACGCPVVSTDCPSGPREILDDGRYGRLVPVGDDAALAGAILATLDAPADAGRLRERAMTFSRDRAVERYLEELFGDDQRSLHRARRPPGALRPAALSHPAPATCPAPRRPG